jgi:hypothetical protein
MNMNSSSSSIPMFNAFEEDEDFFGLVSFLLFFRPGDGVVKPSFFLELDLFVSVEFDSSDFTAVFFLFLALFFVSLVGAFPLAFEATGVFFFLSSSLSSTVSSCQT